MKYTFTLCALILNMNLNIAYAEDQPTRPDVQQYIPVKDRPMSEKEAAFKQFYKRDPACDSFRDDNMMDRCRHAYTTAKQQFEKMWVEKNRKPPAAGAMP